MLFMWENNKHKTVQMYPDPDERTGKLALYGLAGALANTLSLTLAGVILLSSWRWFFRFLTFLVCTSVSSKAIG